MVAKTPSGRQDTEAGADQEVSPGKVAQFQPEIYVTKASKQDLRGRTNARLGRPDIHQIIQETKAAAKAKGGGRVAVFTCGPEALVGQVKSHCRKAGLEVHDEIFDF